MSLLQTLLRPDAEEKSQRAEVARAANLLQIGEFQFIQLAYNEWFGDEMAEERINKMFMAYMLYDIVPHWARHHARHILALNAKGELNDRDPHYHRYDRDYHSEVPQGLLKFSASVAAVILLIGGLLLIGHLTSEGKGLSVLPPYFSKKEIVPQATSLAPGRFH